MLISCTRIVSFRNCRLLSAGITKKFEVAVMAVPKLTQEPSDETKLKMYALYSQAKKGPCTTPAPGMFDLVGKAKHKAWSSLKDMNSDQAMKEYVDVVSKLFGGNIPDSESAPRSGSKPGPVKQVGLAGVVFPRQADQPSTTELSTINVIVEDNGVATVTLNRPSHLNALSVQMWEDLVEAFKIVESNKKARVVILTGSAKSFTSGMDLRVFADMQKTFNEEKCEGRQREAIIRAIRWLQDAISCPERLSIPVIAAVSGHCIGAGVDLITACDLRYCSSDAAFCVKETDLGMVADVGTLQRLPKLVGDQTSRELAYTARIFDGIEAEKLGLVVKSYSSHEELMTKVREVASMIASKSPLTIRGIKKTILYTRDHSVDDSLKQIQYHNAAHLYSSDLMEAMRAAMTKEMPQYKD